MTNTEKCTYIYYAKIIGERIFSIFIIQGAKQNSKLINMTSNSHSTMDDLESEDNTTANPNEQDLANCEGENANLNRQGGAGKEKATDNESGYLHVYSFRIRSDWLHSLNFGRRGLVFVLKLGVINFVCFQYIYPCS